MEIYLVTSTLEGRHSHTILSVREVDISKLSEEMLKYISTTGGNQLGSNPNLRHYVDLSDAGILKLNGGTWVPWFTDSIPDMVKKVKLKKYIKKL